MNVDNINNIMYYIYVISNKEQDIPKMQNTRNIFENLAIKTLICRLNVCAPDWGETECVYGYNKFYYFLDGEGTLIIEGDEYHPAPEELFLIPADTRHTYFHNPKRPVYKYWCHFDLALNEGKKLVYSKSGVKCKVPGDVLIPVFQKLLESSISENPQDVLMEKSALMELLGIFVANIDYTGILPASSDDFSARINSYILRNIETDIKLKQLAETMHLHPNYFIQYFKKHFNVSPIEYVNILRLEKAARLLVSNPDKSIAAIAGEVGFNDYRYFGRLFRRRYGITPTAYKAL